MSEDRFDRELREALGRRAPGPVPPPLARRVADIPVLAVRSGRPAGRGALLMLMAAAALGVALAAGLVVGGWPAVNPVATSTPGPTRSAGASPSSASPAPSPSAASPLPYPMLAIPAMPSWAKKLPRGATVEDWRFAGDTDWLLMNLTFPGADEAAGSTELWAANPDRAWWIRVAPTYVGDFSVDGSQVAWVKESCTVFHGTPGGQSCTSWQIVLTDLDTSLSRVVAYGANTDMVNTPRVQVSSVPLVSVVALHGGVLAYTTGSLAKGVQLRLLTLASGVTHTIALGGMVEEMRWAGDDLAWIEDSGLHLDGATAGYAHPYYASSRLMILPSGATASRQIAIGPSSIGPYSLSADQGRLAWGTSFVNGPEDGVWTASAPDWVPARIAANAAADSATTAGGWLGWVDLGVPSQLVVLRPQDSAPHAVPGGLTLAGRWLVIGVEPDANGYPTQLRVIPLADLE